MENYIHIDLDALKEAQSALNRYIAARAMAMTRLLSEADRIRTAWRATDAEAFLTQWHAMSAPDGVFTVTTENLKKYGELLASIYNIYKKAQSDSVNQASGIKGIT